MEEKDIVNTTAEELSSAKPDYEKEIASIIRSNASPAQIKDKLLDYHENDIAAALDSMSISERHYTGCLILTSFQIYLNMLTKTIFRHISRSSISRRKLLLYPKWTLTKQFLFSSTLIKKHAMI